MKRRIFICDTDTEYMLRIAAYVRDCEQRAALEMVSFSRIEALKEELGLSLPSLMVVNVAFRDHLKWGLSTKLPIMWIGEEGHEHGPDGQAVLSKYRPLPVMIQTWVEAMQDGNEPEGEGGRAPVIALWSVSGGVGKTTIGSWLAKEWRGREKSVFYVPFNAEPAVRFDGENVVYHDLSEWQYYIKSGKKVRHLSVEGYHSSPHIHLFHPDTSLREFVRIRREEATAIMDAASGMADCVFVDAGTGWSDAAEAAWHRSDMILFVATKDNSAELKANKWIEQWPGWKEGEAIWEKTIWVWNKRLDVDREGDRETDEIHFPYVPEWKQQGSGSCKDPLFQYTGGKLMEVLWGRCMKRSWMKQP